MELSIVIVNYNARKFLEDCIPSVIKASKDVESEIIIIDNDSTDDSWEYINKINFPVKSFILYDNKGFSFACNEGFNLSTGENILFLNPDTVISENSINECLKFLYEHPDAGALGVRMIDGDGKFLKESKRGMPTPATSFYKLFGLASLFPGSKKFAKYYLGHLPEKENKEVEILSGAFLMVKREAYEKAGGFDNNFFMYGEDVDLSLRLLQNGYNNYYLGTVTIQHFKGGSTTLNKKYVDDFYGAMKLFVKKHYGNKSSFFRSFLYIGISIRKIMTKISLLFR